jgi:outer membrane protein assembly factor BamB
MLLAVAASTGVLSLSRSALASDGRDGGSDAPDSDSDGDESPHREWPMVGFGPTHTFHQYQTTGPSERLRLAWQYDGVRGVPIVADGVAYLEGRRHDNPTDNHELHAVELRTRERKWWAEIPGRILSEPAVADRTVYVTSEDEGVFALDAATGDVRWQYGINEDVYGIAPPTVADDTVYVPYDGRILALTPDGERRWSRYSEFNRRFPVAVGHGLVFAAYDGERSHCDRGPGVWALNAETGERAWTYPRSDHEAENACGFVAIPPVVADGTVYTCVQTDADDYWDLTALDATTGEKRWDRPVEGGIFGTIAVANRTVYVPLTQRLLAVDSETGDSRWEYRIEIPDHVLAHEFAFSTPTVADGTVYFGTQDGRIHALDAPTGEHRCTYALGDQFDLRRPPTVTDGTVYVTGTYDADQHRQPDDMHLFALRESGDASVTADFEMKRSHWDISGQSDHFRAGYEMGFYGALSTGPISKYEWDLTDDGTVDATGRLVTYTYEEVGSKTVTLRVTGETGATDAVSKSFYVTD